MGGRAAIGELLEYLRATPFMPDAAGSMPRPLPFSAPVAASHPATGQQPRREDDRRDLTPTLSDHAVSGADLAGYSEVRELCRTRRHTVYRAVRERDHAAVLLKVLADSPPHAAVGVALRREFDLLRTLQVDGVARACALETLGDREVLVLEDDGGDPLRVRLARGPASISLTLRLGVHLAGTVAMLHQRRLIHRGISPDGILVDARSGHTTLIDFSLASRLPSEHQQLSDPRELEGTLAYMSPEQTGRMNRDIDYRTDFYSFGVTLYELLTGRVPFDSADPLEVVHGHIARTPAAPSEVDPAIPRPLSDIVMKLLSKTAEHRYQSAAGLRADLAKCLSEWEASGRIVHVVPGVEDIPDRFVIPQRLYGREPDIELLNAAFERVCDGAVELMMVSGYAGIGKTSLIRELYKPLVLQRGYFIAGKFDQIVRVPYGAFIQAFHTLVQQLLTEGEEQLALWRRRLSDALGTGAGVLAEVIPEIELILGPQPAPPPLGPVETQNRFRLVLQNFLRALARREHPVVMFLDDLQWADPATLNLLEPLLTSPDLESLFLIGAYRDNEVDATHPLARTLGALELDGVRLHRLSLGPLTLPNLGLLLRDTLHRAAPDVEPLGRLVLQKTGGNPFFVIQFLKALQEDGLLSFDYERNCWTYRIEAIAEAGMTDNVIDLMGRKIQRLSVSAQSALMLGACIGNRFDLNTLAIASQKPDDVVSAELGEALDEGLVLPTLGGRGAAQSQGGTAAASPSYTFLHDRVQQAAYALIPRERRQLVHLTVGRLLLDRWDRDTAEEKLFDIVHHLNLGSALIADEAERLGLADLNLSAGRRAKSSTAYQAALAYFTAGLALVEERHWSSQYEVMLALNLEAAECEYLCGHTDQAERRVDLLLARARSRLDKARIYALRVVRYEYLSRYTDAIRVGHEALALFGVFVPRSAEERARALDAELAAIDRLVGQRSIDSLIDLPLMTGPETKAVMRLLTSLHTPCYLSGDKLLTLLNSTMMVRLSLEHGYMEESALAYVLHAMHIGPIREDYEAAYQFGLLALRLNDRLPNAGLRAKVLMNFSWAINIWRMPIATSFTHTREAFRLANETGLFSDAAYALFNDTYFTLLAGAHLDQVGRVCEENASYVKRVKMHRFADAPLVIRQWGRALQGLTEAPTWLTGGEFDEATYRGTHAGQNLFEMFYLVAKLAVLYTFGEYRAARAMAHEAERAIREYTGTIWDELRVFYHALTLAALHADAPEIERPEIEATLEALSGRLRKWAENSPRNFLAQHLVVSAEIARVRGRDTDAAALYEAAIDATRDHECPRERGLANELYAKFWRGRGQHGVAAAFMLESRRAYAEWGAMAKVRDLERRYSELLYGAFGAGTTTPAAVAAPSASESVSPPAVALDIATVIKGAQAISGEIELEKLLTRLMHTAIENAGAERGTLLLEHDGRPFVHAEGSVDSAEVKVLDAVPLGEARNLPAGIVNYVRRTSESVVLADAPRDDRYGSDPYIVSRQPRSILCAPVLKQGRLVGVLYLENNLVAGAFTPERIQVMQILASQAATAIENARLFAEVTQLRDRLQAENVLLHEEIKTQHGFDEIVGRSAALKKVLRQVEQVAPTDTTVLITGETGTGKELLARAIHKLSRRSDRPLITVNCGAISPGLVESELFGHEKGAFTGAYTRKIGRFELADRGTIFLDEIGDLPLDLQVRLLRVLQEGEFERVGGTKTISVDVRVIAATHRDLRSAVEAGRFRADLYYRLNIFPIHSPSLRERREDVPLLVRHFVLKYGMKLGKRIETIPKAALDALASYDWPGNIRELGNVIERSVIISKGSVLELGDWSAPLRTEGEQTRSTTLHDLERERILVVLEKTKWRVSGPHGAAAILGLKPTTLEARMKKLGITRPR